MTNKKVTLETLAAQIEKGFASTDKTFEAIADDITDIKRDMVTKDQVIAIHTQISSIERQLRETKTEIRLADLEEKVFGKLRA
jgi:hypothetical protein